MLREAGLCYREHTIQVRRAEMKGAEYHQRFKPINKIRQYYLIPILLFRVTD